MKREWGAIKEQGTHKNDGYTHDGNTMQNEVHDVLLGWSAMEHRSMNNQTWPRGLGSPSHWGYFAYWAFACTKYGSSISTRGLVNAEEMGPGALFYPMGSESNGKSVPHSKSKKPLNLWLEDQEGGEGRLDQGLENKMSLAWQGFILYQDLFGFYTPGPGLWHSAEHKPWQEPLTRQGWNVPGPCHWDHPAGLSLSFVRAWEAPYHSSRAFCFPPASLRSTLAVGTKPITKRRGWNWHTRKEAFSDQANNLCLLTKEDR